MKHFSPLCSLLPGAALIAGCGSQSKDKTSEHSPQKPNVVYLIADDLGIGDLSCSRSPNKSAIILASTV